MRLAFSALWLLLLDSLSVRMMDWLFERTIELAAWVAFILCVVFLCDAGYMLFLWLQSLSAKDAINAVDNSGFLAQSGQAAIKFVGSALAMGLLACIDHYVFDLPEAA